MAFRRWVELGGVFLLVGFCMAFTAASEADAAIQVLYTCDGEKSIAATFSKTSVAITLSDKRNLVLKQTVSASGVRYANKKETVVFWAKGATGMLQEDGLITFSACMEQREDELKPSSVSKANPASENCEKVGGKLMVEKRQGGDAFGVCYFEDNKACEEWALLRGKCPVGGIKTTGFDTTDQRDCALTGGKTASLPSAVCSQ